MGNFSYISQNDDEPLLNPWHQETLCELQFLIEGNVIEKMRGVYNGYGSVKTDKPFVHQVLKDGEWVNMTEQTLASASARKSSGALWILKDWDSIVGFHYSNDISSGIAAWHLRNLEQNIPDASTRSEDDEDQGDRPNHYYDEEEVDDEEDYR